MRRLLQEPFLHFLLLGAALFVLNAWRETKKPPTGAAPRIEVSAPVIARLRDGFERQFGHAPDRAELQDLIAAHIREEVLYREAIAMGLDRDDMIVRRRMAQKMEFLTDDVVGAAEPDDAVLRKFFAENGARYAKPGRVSFRHVYFSKEKHGAETQAAAESALAALSQGASDENMGDAFLHGFEFAEQEPADITAMFGKDFADQIETSPEGEWLGPVASSYGLHLVRIAKRGDAHPASLDEARAAVARDYNDERRRHANREVFEKLKERYDVAVDKEALSKAATPKTTQR